jgi:superfamily II DNA or RNA helicase
MSAGPALALPQCLRKRDWRTTYETGEGDLVETFFVPALAAASRYDRLTGYFAASALERASRGIEQMAQRGGIMRLIVGCTLEQPEVEAISRGLDLRKAIEARAATLPLCPTNDQENRALELVAWMVAKGMLEVKIAVPCAADRELSPNTGIFHMKVGIIHDADGDTLAFTGSLNETGAGWGYETGGNVETFSVFASWDGASRHLRDEIEKFSRLWEDRAPRARIVDLPTAMRERLLSFLPPDGVLPARLVTNHPKKAPVPVESQPAKLLPVPAHRTDDDVEHRRHVWRFIQNAPAWGAAGARVGEATAAVDPWPHQVWAFQRMYNSWPPKLLLADEVGLGKTIEACMILRQAWLAGRARRILVLAPKALLSQWQLELREKFNLDWPQYDGEALTWQPTPARGGVGLQLPAGPTEWHKEPCVLASSHLMRRTDRVAELLELAEPFDLVVLDEAHHARRKGGFGPKTKGPNQLLRLMLGLRERTKGLILLTATPMQVHPTEVRDLLDLLGLPELWQDDNAFMDFFALAARKNPSPEDFERLAAMFRAAETYFGATKPDEILHLVGGSRVVAHSLLDALSGAAATPRRRLETDKRKKAVMIMKARSPVARLISRNTRGLLKKYRDQGGLGIQIADRVIVDGEGYIQLTVAERSVYEAVEEYISTTYNSASERQRTAVGFVMTIYRRRLASSFAALRRTLEKRLDAMRNPPGKIEDQDDEHLATDDETADELPDMEEVQNLEREALMLDEEGSINQLLKQIRALPVDTKATALQQKVLELKAEGYPQVLIFTQFTDTLDFLRVHLRSRGFRVMCFSGRGGEIAGREDEWTFIGRDETKRRFARGEADLLVATDAAAEGLNFQFCGAIINYDLPWNPMRVEQRIGRIDRLGQKFSKIRVVNFEYEDTVEMAIHKALSERIGLFKTFVGKLQPILAKLPAKMKEAALAAPNRRAETEEAVIGELLDEVAKQQSDPFELDDAEAPTVSASAEPLRPPPGYDLDALGRLLTHPALLPPGTEVKRVTKQQYNLSAPGQETVRVTTRRQLFEEHPASFELWSPGSPSFPGADWGPPAREDRQDNAANTLDDLVDEK